MENEKIKAESDDIRTPFKEFIRKFIICALSSTADTPVIQMQDYLGLGSEARMNTPSTLGGNWKWRMESGMLSDELCEKLKNVTSVYKRI